MSRVSFRSRCERGSRKNRNRRCCVTPVPDAYTPMVRIEVLESFDDFPVQMQQPDGPVLLPPAVAINYAKAIIAAAEACLEGH